MKNKKPLVCIVIINWNGRNLLSECISSILKNTTYPNYRVIVADNGSTDGSSDFVRAKFPDVDVLALDKNYGFSGGNNAGTKYALKKYSPDYVLLLNNDIEARQKDWLSRLVDTAEKEDAGVVGCKLVYPDGTLQHADGKYFCGQEDKGQCDHIAEVDGIVGACMLIKKQVLDKVGFLDEIYTPIYYEDVDYCFRVKRAGFKMVHNGFATLIHKESRTTFNDANKKKFYFAVYCGKRNELIFHMLYLPLRVPGMVVHSFVTSVFMRKDPKAKASLGNVAVRPEFTKHVWCFLRAFKDAVVLVAKRKLGR